MIWASSARHFRILLLERPRVRFISAQGKGLGHLPSRGRSSEPPPLFIRPGDQQPTKGREGAPDRLAIPRHGCLPGLHRSQWARKVQRRDRAGDGALEGFEPARLGGVRRDSGQRQWRGRLGLLQLPKPLAAQEVLPWTCDRIELRSDFQLASTSWARACS